MQPLNASALRQPAEPAGSAVTAPADPATPESLGWQLHAALPPMRLHSLSLYDHEANILWLNEGALGPDEHTVVVEAIDSLGRDPALTAQESSLGDGRIAVFLAVRSPQGSLVGLAMMLADIKSLPDGVAERLVTPQLRTILQKLAVLLRPATRNSTRVDAPIEILELSAADRIAPATDLPDSLPANIPTVGPASAAAMAEAGLLTPGAISDLLEFDALTLVDDRSPAVSTASTAQLPALKVPAATGTASASPTATVKTVSAASTGTARALATSRSKILSASATGVTKAIDTAATSTARVLSPKATGTTRALETGATSTSRAVSPGATGNARTLNSGATSSIRALTLPEGMNVCLELQPFSKLRPGGQLRRYEVLTRISHKDSHREPPGLDKFALQQLLTWLGANRAAWNREPTSFTLSLSIATLEDDRFPQFIATLVKQHGISAENIGFEITEALCLQRRAQVERFMTLCDQLGCFVVVDDFSLDSSLVGLLRSKALRVVKIDPKLTSTALKDKLAQAMVVAITQAVRVLGIHCSAKHVESAASLQWLKAVGCDFAQGPAVGPPLALESLAAATPGR